MAEVVTQRMDPVTGEGRPRLGRYELRHRLGRGGMAELWLADARGLSGFGRRTAIKRILPELSSNSELVRLFLAEARLAARLHHRGIVQVFEVGCEDGEYFYAMEFLDGLDLRRLMQDAQLPLEAAVWIVAEVADALHEAHEARHEDGSPLGLVHRDVKPSNLFVTWDGGVKVLDFGIARVRGDPTASKTRTGVLRGTYAYMSPEQVRCLEIDRRSDIYSLGIVMYELATRSRLFARSGDFETLQAIVAGDLPRPSKRAPDCPPQLEQIILKALGRTPDCRFATTAEMASQLRELAMSQLRPWASSDMATWMSSIRSRFAGPAPDASGERAIVPSVSATLTEDEDVGRETPPAGQSTRAWRPRTRSVLLLALAIVATATGGALLYRARGGPRRQPTAAELAPAPAVASREPITAPLPRAEPSHVRVSLEIDPPSAVVEIDGERVADNPILLRAGTEPRNLTIRAVGHLDRSIAITPTRDQTLIVALHRLMPSAPLQHRPRRSASRVRPAVGRKRGSGAPASDSDLDDLLIRNSTK